VVIGVILAHIPTTMLLAETTATWYGEYFDNPDLIGAPVLVREDAAIDFNWDYGAPAAGLPADGFSARWSRVLTFNEGRYRFRATIDDGVRLYVDGDLIIDEWSDGGAREVLADHQMAAGEHAIRVEYYERDGVAVAQVRWETVIVSSVWRGEYWSNRDMAGSPAMVRNDGALAFDWWEGSPDAKLPSDDFSARWTRTVAFDAGTYRFHALVDDGIRIWLNNWLILDAWSDHNSAELETDYVLAKGTYTVVVEYYERIGQARAHVWWEMVPEPTYADWKGEYWSNRYFSGNAALVRNDLSIDFDWGYDAPSIGLPEDDFCVRWTRQEYLHGATYRFHALVDDGVRLWVDGRLLIDAWYDDTARERTAEYTLASGTHEVVVEYYEHTGAARAHVWWRKTEASYPDWKARYWDNRHLYGDPALVRNDEKVDFDWHDGAPTGGIPADDFSVRWSREVTFRPGFYRFYAWADDGIRVYVDGELEIDEWRLSKGDEVYTADLHLSGKHRVVVEYYERGGDARVRIWWRWLSNPFLPM
jgi:hypothetical protein